MHAYTDLQQDERRYDAVQLKSPALGELDDLQLQAEAGQQQQLDGHATLHVEAPATQSADGGATGVIVHLVQRYIWSSGTVCCILAAAIFSVSTLFVKMTGGRVPVLQITLIRSSLSFFISLGLIQARGIKPMFGQRKHAGWLIGRGTTGAIAMISFYTSILLLPLADATTLFFLNPSITAVAAWAIRGEHLGLLGGFGCVASLSGMVVLSHPPMLFGGHDDWGPKRIWGTGMGVFSAFMAACAFICIRFVGRAEPAIVVALSFHTCTMVISVAPLAIGWPQAAAWMCWQDALLLLGVALTSFSAQLSLTRGFQLESAGTAAGLNFSQVLYSYIFGIIFFSEHVSIFGVSGTCLIAVGMLMVTARSGPVQPSEKTNAARDIAGSGFGSRDFSRLVFQRSSSFQHLLGFNGRGLWGGAGGDQSQLNWTGSNSSCQSGPAAQGSIPEDSQCLLRVEQQLGCQRDGSRAAAAAAGDAELVPAGAVQHRHPAQKAGSSTVFGADAAAAAGVHREQVGSIGVQQSSAAAGAQLHIAEAAQLHIQQQSQAHGDGLFQVTLGHQQQMEPLWSPGSN